MFCTEAFWVNESELKREDSIIKILAPAKTDLFCGLDGTIVDNAPMYGCEVEGDCRIEAKVSFTKSGSYDGAGLILYGDRHHWAKTCFEATDFGKIAVISVITNGVSDDANGPHITQDRIWLRLVRKGDDCCILYSLDGIHYELQRICRVNLPRKIMAALIAQAPIGDGGYCTFEEVKVEQVTVENLRSGV